MKFILGRIILFLSMIILSPLILLTHLGFFLGTEEFFKTFGGFLSLFPGQVGSALRVAYYMCTLKKMSPDVFVGFGSFFSKRSAEVGKNSSIGAYCVIGSVSIGEEVIIGSRVSIPSGRYQHGSNKDGYKWETTNISTVKIGDNTWIGEGAIVMADVGKNCIIGGGSVVVKSIPDNKIAVGNPAKPIKERVDV
ncbi:MAG: acyltransferase [Candidatus Helarchaeota archaeon]